jgi:trimeric autotransporter adhesin
MKHLRTALISTVAAFACIPASAGATNNAGDFGTGAGANASFGTAGSNGGVTIGAAYALTDNAPTNGLLVQGNVGIGTPTPNTTLQVNGAVQITSNGWPSTGIGVTILWDGTETAIQSSNRAGSTTLEPLQISASYTDFSNGNVGIGTSNPGAPLTVGNNAFEVNSSGDVTAGIWQGTAVATAYGGTNCTSASITCFNNITGYTASGATGTTSTNVVFSASPTLTGTVTGAASNWSSNVGIGTATPQGLLTIFPSSTVASSASATLDYISVPAATTTITGTTGITTSKGFNAASIYKPTYTDSSSVTVTNAATLYIDNAPAAAGSVTITNPWAISVGAGNVSFPGTGNALGTITSGTWNGSVIGSAYGGLGANESAATGVVQFSSGASSVSTALANGTTATTQSESDTSTKVATDAFVADITTLADLTSAASLATVGTITSGIWNAGAVTSSGGGSFTTGAFTGAITDTQTALGTTSTNGLVLTNTTAATSGSPQQYSPRVHWTGQGWKTNSTAASQTVDMIEELQPQEGTANPSGNLVWSEQVNGGGYSPLMTLTSSGGVGIGTTSPVATLDVQNAVTGTADLVGGFVDASQSTGQYILVDIGQSYTTNNAAQLMFYYAGAGSASNRFGVTFDGVAEKFTLLPSGNVGIGNTSPTYTLQVNGSVAGTSAYVNTSDIRYKKHIEPLSVGLNEIEQLKPVTFEWKQPKDIGMEGQQIGFIAQDVEKVLPSVVITEDNDEETKHMKYTEIIPVLVKAVQELKASDDDAEAQLPLLQARLADDEATIAALKAKLGM